MPSLTLLRFYKSQKGHYDIIYPNLTDLFTVLIKPEQIELINSTKIHNDPDLCAVICGGPAVPIWIKKTDYNHLKGIENAI